MIVELKNAAPPQPPLFHQNIAYFQFKNLIFGTFAIFCISHFSKTKKLPTLLDWYDIANILGKISNLYHALIISNNTFNLAKLYFPKIINGFYQIFPLLFQLKF
jgi:hypothetical protein